MEPKRVKIDDLSTREFRLPLRNKKGEIVAYTLVDEDIYEQYKHCKFHLAKDGYARGNHVLLHRLIIGAKKGEIVDHGNNNRLDNRRCNLSIKTPQENNRNRRKLIGTSSKYYGVDLNKNKWRCCVKVNNKQISFRFNNEEHAAYYRDILVGQYNLIGTKLNNLEKPFDFVEPTMLPEKSKYGVGVLKTRHGNYQASINFNKISHYLGVFDTPEEAEYAYRNKKEELEKGEEEKRLATPIKRNAEGIAIVELFNKKKEKVGETTVSDYRYYEVIKYGWYIDSVGYISGNVNGKTIRLHSYLMNAKPGDLINHINRDRFDNRMENLEFSNYCLNNHNKTKSKNTSSLYFGVSFNKRNQVFSANITKDKKTYYIGSFKDELEAAKAFDKKAIELYGDKARLNFPS